MLFALTLELRGGRTGEAWVGIPLERLLEIRIMILIEMIMNGFNLVWELLG